MTLKTIFSKPVDRSIEGVIKADDEASLRLEIEEYVLTNEVERQLESFLDAYNNYEGTNGVWISGFFGSGKSHLLKMLALFLENRKIEGVPVLDLLLPKCGENEILRGDLKRAAAIKSKSILFNIDQKADVINKTQADALLAVFVKVFDEMCGYYGKQGYIAQFERDLDTRGVLTQFKSAYEATAGRAWQKGREQALLEAQNIAKAYAATTGCDESSATGVLDKYRSQYHVSIEDFAEQVHAYIKRQPPNFRLNFFVDEVGQYIAENVKLMTNLQTIAESLATKSRGHAWVIVTAQEDMGSVVGEMDKQQGNDFSKIQARFANRMKLTSADVAEVIQKRLLLKNEKGKHHLSAIYDNQSNNFKTLFDFSDGSQSYQNFKDNDHFVESYPFIPYQFSLFQSTIQNLSEHNAFEGKHTSVGERSMLGVFQQVAIQIGGYEIGQLATFDLMFEGIRNTLKSNIQRAIIQAENHLNDPFAVRLLKTLFLVKYVKEFKPTVRNLCVLMLDSFNEDLPRQRSKVEEALNLLEQQTYVQRNGDIYEYLTDKEKDVELEIKNTEVDSSEVAAELQKIVFDGVIKQTKIRYGEKGADYPFSKKLDDRLHGRDYELAIHVISPFHENAENESILQMQSMGRDELLVLLPPEERLMREILMYKRTEKYIRQNSSITQQEAIKRILTDKAAQNREREAELRVQVESLISRAKLFVGGTYIEIASESAQVRVLRGFHELINLVYPNLRMLCDIVYTENDIAKHLKHSKAELLGNDAMPLSEAEQEVLAYIQSNKRSGIRTTLKSLLDKFERKPYGWYYAAVLCILAKLCARGKVEVRTEGNLLKEDELERALRNTHGTGNVVLEPQIEFTASQTRVLKEFYEDFFDTSPCVNEAKALAQGIGTEIQTLSETLSPYAAQKDQYPFLKTLMPVIEKLNELKGKPYTWYLTELPQEASNLIQMKEEVIDPILNFMNGPFKEMFENAYKFVQTQEPNFAYIEDNQAAQIKASLNDLDCFQGNRMQQVKTQVQALQDKVAVKVASEVAQAKEEASSLQNSLSSMPEFNALNEVQQKQISDSFNHLHTNIEKQALIPVIRETLRRFEESEYQQLLSQMTSWAQPEIIPKPVAEPESLIDADKGIKPPPPAVLEPRIEYVSSRAVKVSFGKAWLADETDVEGYLQSMRKALLDEIHKGKRIQI